MSRTFRRKHGPEWRWLLRDWVYVTCEDDKFTWKEWRKVHYDRNSPEGKKALIEFHSDWHRSHAEPGPAWFRNMFTERPQRREAKRQIKKFMLDEEYEVILNDKDPLEYWT